MPIKLQRDAFLDMVTEGPYDRKTNEALKAGCGLQESNLPELGYHRQHGNSESDICSSLQNT